MRAPRSGSGLLLATLLVAALCAAGLVALEAFADVDLGEYLTARGLALAALAQTLALLVNAQLWCTIVRDETGVRISMFDALGNIGMLLVGKYLPGKIWGAVARGADLTERGADLNSIVRATIVEQLTYLHGALLVALLAAAAVHEAQLLPFAAAMAIASIWLTPAAVSLLPRFASCWQARLGDGRLYRAIGTLSELHIQRRRYALLVAVQALYWCLGVGIIAAVFVLGKPDAGDKLAVTLLALPLGVVAGLVALWAPSGIGVRDGLLAGLLVLAFPLETAIAAALFYRLWCVSLDLVLGGVAAVALWRRRATT